MNWKEIEAKTYALLARSAQAIVEANRANAERIRRAHYALVHGSVRHRRRNHQWPLSDRTLAGLSDAVIQEFDRGGDFRRTDSFVACELRRLHRRAF